MIQENIISDTTPEEVYQFKEAVSKLSEPHIGKIIKATIVDINENGVMVNLGLKSEGKIPISDFGIVGIPSDFLSGKEIFVIIKKYNTLDSRPLVSYREAKDKLDRNKIREFFNSNTPISAKVIKNVNKLFIVDIGLEAKLPVSQIDFKALKLKGKIEKLLGQQIDVIITEMSDEGVFVSHKKFSEYNRQKHKERIFSTLKSGDIVEGTVTSITDFGAFVDLGGGFEGLIHASDLVWHKVSNVKEILKEGDSVKAKVLKIMPEEEKISLSLKHLLPHPWENIETKYPDGSIVKGKITHITNFGAFVEIKQGVEGLLHISEISWKERINDINTKFKVGDILELKVIETNQKDQRISLSLKRMHPGPFEELKNKYPPGTLIKGQITNIMPFGAFVSIDKEFEGLIHLNDISWTKKIKHPDDIFEIGQEIEAVISDIDIEKEKIMLSIRHKFPDPFKKYGVGTNLKGTVTRIIDKGVYVNLEPEVEAFLHLSEISQQKIKHPSEVLHLGQEIEAKVIRSSRNDKKIEISIKKFEIEKEQELLDKYSQVQKQSLGEIIEEQTI